MPFLDVFICSTRENDGFSWNPTGDAFNIGNLPKVLGPGFPPSIDPGRPGAWDLVSKRIEQGRYPGRRIDYAASAGLINLEEILELVEEVFPTGWTYDDPGSSIKAFAHLDTRLIEFRQFIANLEPGAYIIVACESG